MGPAEVMGAWWDGSEAKLAPGASVSFCIVLAVPVGFLASRGRQRTPVLTTLLGAAALHFEQPRFVYITLISMGAVAVLASASSWRAILNLYRDVELRRMKALDMDVVSPNEKTSS